MTGVCAWLCWNEYYRNTLEYGNLRIRGCFYASFAAGGIYTSLLCHLLYMKKERLLLQPLLVVIPLGIIPQQR